MRGFVSNSFGIACSPTDWIERHNPFPKKSTVFLDIVAQQRLYTPGFPSSAARIRCEYTPSRVALAAFNTICGAECSPLLRGCEADFTLIWLCRNRSPGRRLPSLARVEWRVEGALAISIRAILPAIREGTWRERRLDIAGRFVAATLMLQNGAIRSKLLRFETAVCSMQEII
jgi:hypothetical protein